MADVSTKSILQIVVHVEDGNGFTFVNRVAKVFFIATLNGISLESIPVEAGNPTEFNTELVWEVQRKDLRKLKLNNVPIKLECYSTENGQKEKIGYLMLSLKSAPTLNPSASSTIEKKWLKLLGLSPKFRIFQPEIFLQVFIEDSEKVPEIYIPQIKELNMSMECQDIYLTNIIPELKNEKEYIQIGPEQICTDTFLIHIFLAAPTNFSKIKTFDREHNTFTLYYNICGIEVHTNEFKLDANGNTDFTEKTILRLKSNLRFLKQYFNQVQTIKIHLLSGKTELAYCQAKINDIITTIDLSEFISISKKNFHTVCKCEISYFYGTSDSKPLKEVYLKTGISLKYLQPEGSPDYKNIANEPTGAHYNMEYSESAIDQSSMLQLENIVNNLSYDKKENIFDKFMLNHGGDKAKPKIEFKNSQATEIQCHQSTSLNKYLLETITEETNPASGSANIVVKKGGGDKVEDNESNENISLKIVEELEDWKEKQQEMFLTELKKKEEKHLGHLSSEWYKKRTEIESQLKKKIEHSRSLAIALEKANNDAKSAGIKNFDTEKQLIKAKEDLERQYSLQYLDLKEAARRLEDDLNHKLTQSNMIKNDLAEKIQNLQKENKRLQDLVTKQQEEYESIKKSSLNKEQTATLVHQLKTAYEKLLEAQKSKAFFKEQWARALREVHRIKSDQQQSINVQIKRNKAIDLQALLKEQEEAHYDNKELQEISRRLQTLSTDSSNQSSACDVKDCQLLGTKNLSTALNGMDYFRTGFSSRSSTNTEDSDSDNAEARQLLKNYDMNQIDSEDD